MKLDARVNEGAVNRDNIPLINTLLFEIFVLKTFQIE